MWSPGRERKGGDPVTTTADAASGLVEDLAETIAAIESLVARGHEAWVGLCAADREAHYRALEEARKKLTVVDVDFIQAHERELPRGKDSKPAYLAREFHITRREARARLAATERISEGPDRYGRERKGHLPTCRNAVLRGRLDSEGLATIHKHLDNMPAETHHKLTKVADAPLAEIADQNEPDSLNKIDDMLYELLGDDKVEHTPNDKTRLRDISISKIRKTGMYRISGRLSPRCAAVLKRLFADYAGRGSLMDESTRANQCPQGAQGTLGAQDSNAVSHLAGNKSETAETDDRGIGQRRHDALEAAIFNSFTREEQQSLQDEAADILAQRWADYEEAQRQWEKDTAAWNEAQRQQEEWEEQENISDDAFPDGFFEDSPHGSGPMDAGPIPPPEPPEWEPDLIPRGLRPRRGSTTIVAVTNLYELLSGQGHAMTDAGVRLDLSELIEDTLANDLYLSVLGFEGQSLWLGRASRLGSLAQYLALCAEEGGSTAPGTATPPAYCHIHHIDGWERGGSTDIDNLTLCDPGIHAKVDDNRENPRKYWSLRGRSSPPTPSDASATEKVQWIPPITEDPHRRPRINNDPQAYGNPGRSLRRLIHRPHPDEQHQSNTHPPHSANAMTTLNDHE